MFVWLLQNPYIAFHSQLSAFWSSWLTGQYSTWRLNIPALKNVWLMWYVCIFAKLPAIFSWLRLDWGGQTKSWAPLNGVQWSAHQKIYLRWCHRDRNCLIISHYEEKIIPIHTLISTNLKLTYCQPSTSTPGGSWAIFNMRFWERVYEWAGDWRVYSHMPWMLIYDTTYRPRPTLAVPHTGEFLEILLADIFCRWLTIFANGGPYWKIMSQDHWCFVSI